MECTLVIPYYINNICNRHWVTTGQCLWFLHWIYCDTMVDADWVLTLAQQNIARIRKQSSQDFCSNDEQVHLK